MIKARRLSEDDFEEKVKIEKHGKKLDLSNDIT
jgi:hypothetical protein